MNFLLLFLAVAAVAATQMLAGGRDTALCLPGYALLALAAVLSWWPWRRTPIPRRVLECLAVAVLFCAYVSVRALFSPEAFLAHNDLYAALSAMTLYLLVALNVTASRLRLLLVAALLALALADCAIGAVQFFKGQNFMPFPFFSRPDYEWRASGFYGYPNHLSGFLEMTLMLGLSLVFWSRWPTWVKMLVGYICFLCLLCILATGSRGGYISTAVGLVVFTLLSLALVGKLASGRLIGVLLAMLLLMAGVSWGVRQVLSKSAFIHSRADETLSVDSTRMRIWQAAWKQFRLQPVAGTGSGTFLYYGRQFRSPMLHSDPIHAHNDYFELLAEYGILGIVAAVIFLETHLRNAWNSFAGRISRGPNDQGLSSNSLALTIGALSAAAACLMHSLLDFNLHMPANLLTAALIFGLLASPGEGPDAGDLEQEPGLSPILRLALPALGILLVVCVGPTAPAEYYAERTRAIMADWHRAVSPEPNIKMEAIARQGLAWNAHDPELHYAVAEALSDRGDLAVDPPTKEAFYTQAVESYRAALADAPGDVYSILALASALDSLERYSESDPLYERALILDPRGGLTHISVGQHLLAQGKFAEAEAEFRLGEQLGGREAAKAGLAQIEAARKAKGGGDAPPHASAPSVN